MRKTALVVSACLVGFVFVFCISGASAQQKQDEIAVLERAEEFVGAMYHKDFGKIWNLATPWIRQDLSEEVPKDEYVEVIREFFEQSKIVDYDSSKLVVVGEKYAITDAEITFERKTKDRVSEDVSCMRTLWLKFPDEWYWYQTNLSCNYMPSTEEIEQLTRDLK